MASEAIGVCAESIRKVYEWFTVTLDATGMGGFYLAMVFLCMLFGFLLLRFGSALSVGSDFASAGVRSAHNAFAKGKYGSGRKVRSNPGYKGKFETRSNAKSGHRATPKRNIR